MSSSLKKAMDDLFLRDQFITRRAMNSLANLANEFIKVQLFLDQRFTVHGFHEGVQKH